MSKKFSRVRFKGEYLKKLREEKGCKTPKALAFEIYNKTGDDMVPVSIEKHESGTHMPRLPALWTYHKFFNVDIASFLEEVDDDNDLEE